MSNDKSYMVLRDDEDNYYAIPREVIDHHKVRREWKAKLRMAMDGEDVEGFAMAAAGASKAVTTTVDVGALLHLMGMTIIEEADLYERAAAP
jgi:hypothetical protein